MPGQNLEKPCARLPYSCLLLLFLLFRSGPCTHIGESTQADGANKRARLEGFLLFCPHLAAMLQNRKSPLTGRRPLLPDIHHRQHCGQAARLSKCSPVELVTALGNGSKRLRVMRTPFRFNDRIERRATLDHTRKGIPCTSTFSSTPVSLKAPTELRGGQIRQTCTATPHRDMPLHGSLRIVIISGTCRLED
ncbi:uncharacterized protein K460DRAFT_66969 [Cucurbitaria berberidis CBS 394.84]|uniref:Secreted protein n=1 Tax=Cucurbitaria berberidis CBS 394.84 TaxID=1168544 RepID=A0A9P4GMF9_9PLEO|nr:uncharacterized protein K460DRAFT_66969 [Cucurbitaria berberidis CBS 394.84]KAF1848011.1 hypothetical protein K460DRAFT_66969 [Cucurbitaria berberidis CBS 394.84]